MICTEPILIPIIAFIISLHEKEKLITRPQADDLIECVRVLIDQKINENNIAKIVDCLRDRKASIDKVAVSRVIKLLLRSMG